MFFQIAITPPNPVKKPQTNSAPLEEVAILKLAPFTPTPKVFFENILVGNVEAKKLIIQNPTAYTTKLTITKLPPADRNVSLSWHEIEIEPQGERILEIEWAPREEGSWRDVLIIRDNQNVNRNIPVIFKSIQRKVKKRTTKPISKTKPTVIAAPAVKKFRSPKNLKTKRSPPKESESACIPISCKCKTSQNNVHITTCSPVKKKTSAYNNFKERTNFMECNKENSPIISHRIGNLSPIIFEPKSENISFSQLSFSEKVNLMDSSVFFSSSNNINSKNEKVAQKPLRRDTYVIKSPEKFNDSLEMEKILENLQSTPEVRSPRERQKNQRDDSFNNKFKANSTFELSGSKKIENFEFSPNVSINSGRLTDIFLNKSENISADMSAKNQRVGTSDHYLVEKLLSDSFAFATGSAENKLQNFQFVLNDTKVIEDIFYPKNCSTETKVPEKISRINSSTPKELFKPNSTYEISPANKKDCSLNLSGDTYTINNISSSSTYAILSPDALLRTRELTDNDKQAYYPKMKTSSPLVPHSSEISTPNHFNFSGINAKTALYCITEEHSSEISRNISNCSGSSTTGFKRKSEYPEVGFTISPPKRAFLKPHTPKPVKNINSSWSKNLEKTEKIRRKSISSVKLNLNKIANKSSISDVSTSSVNISQTSCNIDPFLIAAIYDTNLPNVNKNLDPFISSTLYYDEKWLDKQIQELKKWLNALLTPPSELASITEVKKVDVAKIWQDCVKKDLIYAPTKEKVSSKYHTNHKLEILRKSARNLFNSPEIRNVLSKVVTVIEDKFLTIREDRKLHLDVGLQSHVLTLLLCYNPLWLRIGLETIYNETIPLESNSDVIGLSTFIMLRFFRCPNLMPKNKQAFHSKYLPNYGESIKKFTLKKFLMLLFFLDQAKNKKLISHDPCLFCQNAPIKESKELLLSFSRELLSAAVGDVTKFLRRFGYEITHKQSFIDEFDYAVKNLSVDLRDGIRLTKVMEIILLRNDLSNQLRGPVISRLQKIYNVKLAFDALSDAGYTIAGDITAKDIVDGHREKTLSLLWQIVYKFQAPRFSAAAIKIQKWWKSLQIVIKRRILDRPRQQRINAAIKIQNFYRSWKLMLKERAEFLQTKQAVIQIQRFTRSIILAKRDRVQYLVTRQSAIIIQQKYRANKLMKSQQNDYLKLKAAVILLQHRFRAKIAMKTERANYSKLKNVAIRMQRNFRSKKVAKEQRKTFLEKRTAAVKIQRHFRGVQQMRKDRNSYLQQKNILIKVQQRFRATNLMKKVRESYLKQRKSIIFLQQKYRANILMKEARKSYLERRQAVIKIQQTFKSYLIMKKDRENYLQQRKAAIIIQKQFRAHLQMRTCREDFLKLRQAVVVIQRRFRANIAMKNARKNYLRQKSAAILIQNKFRANSLAKQVRNDYLQQREAAITIQKRFRAQIKMKICHQNYSDLKNAAVYVQRKFRANQITKQAQSNYQNTRKAAIIIQTRFRAQVSMKICHQSYLDLKKTTLYVQRRFRANQLMKQAMDNYKKIRKAAITVQTRFRAQMQMKICRQQLLDSKKATLYIQRRFRANQLTKQAQSDYHRKRKAAITIQERFRAQVNMQICRREYLNLKKCTIYIQRKFRANQLAKQDQNDYQKIRKATITIQTRFRANQLMKQARNNYQNTRQAAIIIQARFRAQVSMKSIRQNYLDLKEATLYVQRRLRANQLTKQAQNDYHITRNAAIKIQQMYRAQVEMKICRQKYLDLKKATLYVQRKFRANQLMKQVQSNYQTKRNVIITIQKKYRARVLMKNCRQNYLKLKAATIAIQRRFRAKMVTTLARNNYLKLKNAVVIIQQKFKANQGMRKEKLNFLKKKAAVTTIQRRFRAYRDMKICRENYLELRKYTVLLQQRFRANLLVKKKRQEYVKLREAAIKIQRYYRAYREKYLSEEMELKIRSVIKIQSWVRMHAAKKQLATLRENSRETEEKKEARRLNKAAVKIQALWHGYQTRKRMTKRMALIRQRSQEAANNALPEFKMGQRNQDAVDLLMFQTTMKDIIRALTVLDFTTRLFPDLCIEVCNEITERLYILLVCTNRSMPDMDASILCISILINLYKFEPTSAAVWKEQYLERLLLLLLHWSDKDVILFPYICTLLWLFAQKPEYYKIIKAEENADRILKKTYQQFERRQKMLTKMRNAPSNVNMRAPQNVLPSLVPDWGIINANRPRVFMNPAFAIKCLLKKFDISP